VGGNPRSVTIPDARGNGASFRVTRHQAERKIVLSQWRGGVCVASTPIELSEVPALIGIFADALGEAVVESVAHSSALSRAAAAQAAAAAAAAEARTTAAHTSLVACPPEVWTAKRGLNRDRAEPGQGRLTPAALRQSSLRAWATVQGRLRPAWAEITQLRPPASRPVSGEAAPTGPASGRPYPSGASG
jgi:hypothetical protein